MLEFYQTLTRSTVTKSDTIYVLIDSLNVVIHPRTSDSWTINLHSELIDSLFTLLNSSANTSKQNYAILLSLAIAFLAAIVGPFVQWYNAKKQLKIQSELAAEQNRNFREQLNIQLRIAKSQIAADVLSKNKQSWVDKIRANISDFIAILFMINNKDYVSQITIEQYSRKFEQLLAAMNQINLLLDTMIASHLKLRNAIANAVPQYSKDKAAESPPTWIVPILEAASDVFKEIDLEIKETGI